MARTPGRLSIWSGGWQVGGKCWPAHGSCSYSVFILFILHAISSRCAFCCFIHSFTGRCYIVVKPQRQLYPDSLQIVGTECRRSWRLGFFLLFFSGEGVTHWHEVGAMWSATLCDAGVCDKFFMMLANSASVLWRSRTAGDARGSQLAPQRSPECRVLIDFKCWHGQAVWEVNNRQALAWSVGGSHCFVPDGRKQDAGRKLVECVDARDAKGNAALTTAATLTLGVGSPRVGAWTRRFRRVNNAGCF